MIQTSTIFTDNLVSAFESLDEISEALIRRGSALYGSEAVTQLEQAKRFIGQPHADDAVRLRRWDDAAKITGLATRSLEHFIGIAQQVRLKEKT